MHCWSTPKRLFVLALGYVVCGVALVAYAEVTVRVQETPGGPQIQVNGYSIPPRFFWGAERTGRIVLGDAWADYAFEFTPEADTTGNNGRLHFRFGNTPGDVWLSAVRIVGVADGVDALTPGSLGSVAAFEQNWGVWPVGAANTVGRIVLEGEGLHVTLTPPPAGETWPDFHIYSRSDLSLFQGKTYRCSFRARASSALELGPAVYRIDKGVHTQIGGPPGAFLSQVALARDAGVNLVSFAAPLCWSSPDPSPDWTSLDSLCRRIIAVNPNVLLVPRLGVDAPEWWLALHPGSRMVYDGQTIGTKACVSDRIYRAAVVQHLEKVGRHLSVAFPDHFAGMHPCGQNTGEWFYQDAWKRPLSGYDAATRVAFRAWLTRQGDPGAMDAEPPSADERRGSPNGLLRDPAGERRLFGFARFQQEEMADFILALAGACRRGTEGRKLVVFFYGYGFEFSALSNGAPTSGHYDLTRLLKSPARDIDILCSPISYTDRDWLGTAPCMSAAESVTRAGILWLNEDDSRTFLDPRQEEHVQEGGLVDLKQTQQIMLRNTAQAAIRGFGTWWMDLPAMGWFNDAAIWRQLVLLRSLDAAMLAREHPFQPEIAAIIDEESMCCLAGGSAAAVRPLIYEGRAALGRSGAPYGQYLLQDVVDGRVSARMQVFLAAWMLDTEERKALAAGRTVPDARGITRVWCWAPGYLTPDRADVAGIRALTGFEARAVEVPTAEVTPTERGRAQGLMHAWGPKTTIRPLFCVEAAADEVLATYADGSAAVAVRRSEAGLDVFVGVPQLTPELVYTLAGISGVHLFTSPGPALWATGDCLSIQAHAAGPIKINTGSETPVYSALDGTLVGPGPQVELDLEKGDVRVLRY